jgi:hypothetical protein
MNAADVASMAWTNLRRRKGRTALTAAGVVIGVASLVLMISLGLGLKRQVLQLFQTEDELRTLDVTRQAAESGGTRSNPMTALLLEGDLLPLSEKDLEQMRVLPGVEAALPNLDMFVRFRLEWPGGSRTFPAPVGAPLPQEERGLREALVEGRLWESPAERACLLPRPLLEIRLGLKPKDVIGARVTLGSTRPDGSPEAAPYTCVGVFDPERLGLRGRKIMLSRPNATELREATRGGAFSLIPYEKGTYPAATVRLADPKAAQDVAARLRNSGYKVLSSTEMIQKVNVVFLIIEGFMACIGAIGLVVSLFGIANTMATAVLERTREIGIMKAVGALNRDVSRIFLAEAAGIGALGGCLGLALGFLVGKLLNAIAQRALDLHESNFFHVSAWLAVGSVAFSILVSVAAGFVPARHAARLDPVVSLRFE